MNTSIVFSALEGVAYGVAALAMWKWKKWGVYLYAAVAVAGMAVRTLSGPLDLGAVQMGLELGAFGFVITVLILYSILKPKWQYFSWAAARKAGTRFRLSCLLHPRRSS